MRAKGYEEWLSRNVGKGGKRPSYDPFNKAKKGSERNPRAEEYANKGVKEFHDYSERRKERTADDDNKQNDAVKSESAGKTKSSKNVGRTSKLVRNIVARVVAVVAGAVVVVSGYQAIKSNNETVVSTVWTWSEDYSTANIKLINIKGNTIAELPATVDVTKVDPTCTQEGLLTYSASVEYKETAYSDEKKTVLSPTGHNYDYEHAIITTVDGVPTIIIECEDCHDKVTIGISPSEN